MSFKFAHVAAAVGVAAAVASPFAFGQSVVHESSPHSGGLQMARKVQAQRAGEAAVAARTESGDAGIDISCSPKPCVLPNVQASAGPQPVNENAIAANPATGTDLVSTGNDYNCPSLQGIFTSNDSGSTWRRACMTALPGNSGLGDPVPAYDTQGRAHVVGINSADGGSTGVIVTQRSLDQGLTFRAARQAVPNTLGGIADKPWLEADTNAASPFKDSLYISVTNFASTSDSQITVSRSRDGGNTWATANAGVRQTFPDVHQFSDLAVGRDGTVYLT
jgi:hypothetical protein